MREGHERALVAQVLARVDAEAFLYALRVLIGLLGVLPQRDRHEVHLLLVLGGCVDRGHDSVRQRLEHRLERAHDEVDGSYLVQGVVDLAEPLREAEGTEGRVVLLLGEPGHARRRRRRGLGVGSRGVGGLLRGARRGAHGLGDAGRVDAGHARDQAADGGCCVRPGARIQVEAL